MLRELSIHDFALVKSLNLEFGEGMTVLTGETGAGKSILLGALGLVLGDRADSGVVRHGCARAEINARFQIDSEAIRDWLREQELDDDEGECLLRRTIGSDGRSRGYINGRPTPIQLLRELGDQLVDLHGQHAHQSLLKAAIQRQLVDDYAGHGQLLSETEQAYQHWKALNGSYEQLRQASQERESRIDFLRFQVQELEALELSTDELAGLDEEHARLANSHKLQEGAQQAIYRLENDDNPTVINLLEQALRELQELQGIDPALASATELLEGATIQSREALSEIRHYVDSVEHDPQRLEAIEQRLGDIHNLARKHHCDPEQLTETLQAMGTELAELESAEERLEGMQEAIQQALDSYFKLAAKLTASRQKAAKALGERVTDNMQTLGMKGGLFQVALEAQEAGTPAPHGMERISFMVSANPGQPLRPLNKVASGGELSRISLAIQVIAAGERLIPTQIFDEVDVGVGGGVAEMVGRQLHELARSRQVFCITHQPQVASQGRQHYQISKTTKGNETWTEVEILDEDARVDEVARMLGGMTITEQTRSHAREMLQRGDSDTPPQRKKA